MHNFYAQIKAEQAATTLSGNATAANATPVNANTAKLAKLTQLTRAQMKAFATEDEWNSWGE